MGGPPDFSLVGVVAPLGTALAAAAAPAVLPPDGTDLRLVRTAATARAVAALRAAGHTGT